MNTRVPFSWGVNGGSGDSPPWSPYTQFKDEYSSPVFMGGKWRIWGFTAMVTNLFLKSLLATDGYAHPIQYVPSIKKGTTFPKTTRKH
ncbi:hypothetical protein QE152_g4826 [Popillia japonica]|uniref:Uncharacterized protein n=1 Tax=Popillia japonica TaxID=7064 RepID=A0AAW1MZ20_POPJA